MSALPAGLLFLLLLPAVLDATKPTARVKSPETRRGIESLRYSPGESPERGAEKFLENLRRDCRSFAYGKQDLDLTVPSVLKTYPEALAAQTVRKNLRDICPKNFLNALKVFPRKLQKKTVVRRYIARNRFQDELQSIGNVGFARLVEILAENCGRKDVAAFTNLYCRNAPEQPRRYSRHRKHLAAFSQSCGAGDGFLAISCKRRPPSGNINPFDVKASPKRSSGGSIKVFINKSAVQCGSKGLPLEMTYQTLTGAGIEVLSSSCGARTGLAVMSVCGAGTMDINIHEIPRRDAGKAKTLGFTFVPEFKKKNLALGIQEFECR